MTQARWNSPLEWIQDTLTDLYERDSYFKILEIARTLAGVVDAEEIKNLFQEEMEDDGFFAAPDLITCNDCSEDFDRSQIADPDQHRLLHRTQLICLNCHREWLQDEDLSCQGCREGTTDGQATEGNDARDRQGNVQPE